MAKFSHTLSTGETSFSTNLGFRMRDANIFTYSQTKIGFNYFYCKREVQDDGITTKPLNITLSPWETESLVVSEVQDPLSNLYYSHMRVDALSYHSIEQMFYHLLAKHYENIILCHKILMEADPLNVYIHLDKAFISKTRNQKIKKDIMQLCLSEKFRQCQNFRDRLESLKAKAIFYKQPNYSREDEAYWGVSNSSKLIPVLPPNSLAGNNIMGELLMDLYRKLCS